MSESNRGWRRALRLPAVYGLLQRAVGSSESHPRFIREHVTPQPGQRLLDLGCGTGDIVKHLPPVWYLGVDLNPLYIEEARRRHGDRGRFERLDIRTEAVDGGDPFDIVLAMGILHHLDDEGAHAMLRGAAHALRPEGRLVAIDPAWAPGQPRVAKLLIGRDRGQAVRDADGYGALARTHFDEVSVQVRGDLLRVPYTHAVLECARPTT
ncbi:MAG TPA: class I SAM-dependent methyltransferase [Thermoleophilaceae bacterium]|jgi:SAM-dependent methyltransferase